MNNEPRRGDGLAVATIVVVAALALALVCWVVFAVTREYRTSKLAAQERAIKVMRQIEAREAAQRAAELSSKAIESKDGSATTTTPDG